MRTTIGMTLLLIACGLAGAAPAGAAQGVFDLSWDSCTGPLDRTPTSDDRNALFATVHGADRPHTGYVVQIEYGNGATGAVPDAWRFDRAGCQAGWQSVFVDHLAPAALASTCSSFHGPAASEQLKDVSRIPESGLLRITLVNSYATDPVTPDPAVRYFLARIRFDHTFSVAGETTPGVDCGGFETSICFATATASYQAPDGTVIDFGLGGTRAATVHGASGCSSLPASTTTWGAIKGQYRR